MPTLADIYTAEFTFLDTEFITAKLHSTGGNLLAIRGDLTHDDAAAPATHLLATNTEDGDLADAHTGYWLVGLYDDNEDTSDEALCYGEGETLEQAYNAARTALRELA